MQGKFIIGAFLVVALASPSLAANDSPKRQACQKGESAWPVQQAQQRQRPAQQPQARNKPQGCLITRSIPSVIDPTPTFLL